MPLMPGLLRRRGPSSDVDIRRHSFLSPEATGNMTLFDGRASEQIPRRPSAAEFLSPGDADAASDAAGSSVTRASAESSTARLERSISPPVQEENHKHRRFSMLKFRHASDSQLSARARQQAQAQPVPPMPHREYHSTPLVRYHTDKDITSPRNHHDRSYDGHECNEANEEEVASTTARTSKVLPRYHRRRTAHQGHEERKEGEKKDHVRDCSFRK